MGQYEIMTFFQNNKKKWFITKELKEIFKERGLAKSLTTLRRWKLLEFEKIYINRKYSFTERSYKIDYRYKYKPGVISK